MLHKDCFVVALLLLAMTVPAYAQKMVVRVGHAPNVTHAQALIGQADGWFEKGFGNAAELDWKIFSAGPSVIESMFAGQLDMAYVGPSPAINGYVKSNGEAVRIIAGSASGGAALVVRADAGISKSEDFHGKKIASPQLGNTQDVALRAWLKSKGFKLKEVGGDVQVIPMSSGDQLTLFLKEEIDGAWTVEPWVSQLMMNANAKLFLSESELWPQGEYATCVILVRKKFLDEHADLVKKFLKVHVDITDWIAQNPEKAEQVVAKEIENETKKALPQAILFAAMKRVHFTYDAMEASIARQAQMATEAGFFKKEPDLSGLFDLKLLKEVLSQKEKCALDNAR